jgi:hypothetical protein
MWGRGQNEYSISSLFPVQDPFSVKDKVPRPLFYSITLFLPFLVWNGFWTTKTDYHNLPAGETRRNPLFLLPSRYAWTQNTPPFLKRIVFVFPRSQGDLGDPLIAYNPATREEELVGLASPTFGCDNNGTTVFISINAVKDWVIKVISQPTPATQIKNLGPSYKQGHKWMVQQIKP